MSNLLLYIFLVITLVIIFSPVYLQRRKLWQMADEDLKKNNYSEWKKQMKSNVYIKFGSRIIWGLFILSGFFLKFQEVIAQGFRWITIFVFLLGISCIIWGFFSFRRDIRKLQEIN